MSSRYSPGPGAGPSRHNSHNSHRDRERDNGYPPRNRDHRDNEPGPSRERDRRRDGRPYTSGDRERERRDERGRYDERDKRDRDRDREGRRSQSPKPPRSPPKPNFAPSGLLAKETLTVKVDAKKAAAAGLSAEQIKEKEKNGVVLKYSEGPESRKPASPLRLFEFKGSEQVGMYQLRDQSCYLFGRDKIVVDIPIAHPSASKQHAVLQFRQVVEKNEFGDAKTRIKPFIIDLDSTNGTFVNDEQIPASRYYELRQKDVLRFAQSSREYVLLSEDGV